MEFVMKNRTEPPFCSDDITRNLCSLESIVYDVSTSLSTEAQKALDRLSKYSNTSPREITDSQWDAYYKYTV
jgi:hypothetical protein